MNMYSQLHSIESIFFNYVKEYLQTCFEFSASAIRPSDHSRMEDIPSGPDGIAVDLFNALAYSPVCRTNLSTCCCVELKRKP